MPPSKRPRSIAELAEIANPAELYDPNKTIREQFRLINTLREQSYDYKTSGDIENAFITLARVASLILDKIPSHSEYGQLSTKQKAGLAGNGQTFIDMLQELKPQINDRYEAWIAQNPNKAGSANITPVNSSNPRADGTKRTDRQEAPKLDQSRQEELRREELRIQERLRKEDGKKRAAAERAKWEEEQRRAAATKQQLEDARRVEDQRRRLEDERRRIEAEVKREVEEQKRQALDEARKRAELEERKRAELRERTLSQARSIAAEHERQEQERIRQQEWEVSAYEASHDAYTSRPPPPHQSTSGPVTNSTATTEAERRHMQRLEAERMARREDWRQASTREQADDVPKDDSQTGYLRPGDGSSRASSHRPSPSLASTSSSLAVAVSSAASAYSPASSSDSERVRVRVQRVAEAAAQAAAAQAKEEETRRTFAAIKEKQESANRAYQAATDRLRDESRNRTLSLRSTQNSSAVFAPQSNHHGPPVQVLVPHSSETRLERSVDPPPQSEPLAAPKPKKESPPRSATAAQAKEYREAEARIFVAMRAKERQEEASRLATGRQSTTPPEEIRAFAEAVQQSANHSTRPASLHVSHPSSGRLSTRDSTRTPYSHRSREPSPRPSITIPEPAPEPHSSHSAPPAIPHQRSRSSPTSRAAAPAVASLQQEDEGPTILPLESPTRVLYPQDPSNAEHDTPTRRGKQVPVTRSQSYPPLVSTTSPLPPGQSKHLEYPAFMTAHQKQQGYIPSTNSIFIAPVYPEPPASSLLFQPANAPPHLPPNIYGHPLPSRSHSSSYQVPNSSQSFNAGSSYRGQSYGNSSQPYPSVGPSRQFETQYPLRPGYLDYRPARPTKDPMTSSPTNSSLGLVIPTLEPDSDQSRRTLRTVMLPPSTLPRFLSIAKVNTTQNRETCGLLMGKIIKDVLYVSTLLIPKQEGTSDTCNMTNEELVVQFQIDRELTTFGWIHTHPSQSCFMSSMDLHTHASYQKMLPEAIAIVCSPKQTPNFGIFRLTEPPGLQLVLSCHDKRSFHPHSETDPIYTDADSSHVKMEGGDLEIIDLR